MKIIALEEHFLTPAIHDANGRLPPEQRDVSFNAFDRGLDAQLRELGAERLRRMDDAGVDVAVLSVTTPATQSLAAAEAVPLAREANDALADAAKAHPDRYFGFATLPTPDPAAAAVEFARCVQELGFCGAMVNGRTGDRYLDHPDFYPMFETAAALNVPIYIHPQSPPVAVRQAYYAGFEPEVSVALSTAGWGWHVETAVHALRMILSGVFDRQPSLQIILGHWGEMLPFYLERVDAILSRAAKNLQRPVADYFRQNFHVTPAGIYSVPMLLHAVETLGADRILFATDDPFVPQPPGAARAFLEKAPISPADREKIAGGNARKLLKLSDS